MGGGWLQGERQTTEHIPPMGVTMGGQGILMPPLSPLMSLYGLHIDRSKFQPLNFS